jgi:hypothetical protein
MLLLFNVSLLNNNTSDNNFIILVNNSLSQTFSVDEDLKLRLINKFIKGSSEIQEPLGNQSIVLNAHSVESVLNTIDIMVNYVSINL